MKAFSFTIHCRTEDKVVAAYEPSADAPFVVHRELGWGDEWVVTHRGSTHLAGHGFRTRALALVDAEGLCGACPSAALVGSKRIKGGKGGVEPTGPYASLRDEIVNYRKSVAV